MLGPFGFWELRKWRVLDLIGLGTPPGKRVTPVAYSAVPVNCYSQNQSRQSPPRQNAKAVAQFCKREIAEPNYPREGA